MVIISISGMRFIIDSDISVKDIFKFGRIFGKYIRGGTCSVGYDTRSTSHMVSKSLICGLISSGCLVLDLGVTSTPAIFREVFKSKLEGGLSVTASHNPPNWNGVKFIVKGGRGLFQEELNSLLRLTSKDSNEFLQSEGIYPMSPSYPEDIVNYLGKPLSTKIRIALDLGGGAGSTFIPDIFSEIGAKVYTINSSPGIFSRNLDPTIDNLCGLTKMVQDNDLDLGAAFDCDADRVVFIGKDGNKLPADYTLLIYLMYLVESNQIRDIVISVDTSKAAEDIVKKSGFNVKYSRVGEANVVQKMIEEKISVGGEGSSGGLIISDFNLCRDGVLATAIITKIIEQFNGLEEIVKRLPRYHRRMEKIQCSRDEALQIIEALKKSEGEVDSTDGVKIKRSDGSWILVRPSGTENIIRLSVEARDEHIASSLVDIYADKISELLRGVRDR